jgi:hypothetical protein
VLIFSDIKTKLGDRMKFTIHAQNASDLKDQIIDLCKTFQIEFEIKQLSFPIGASNEEKKKPGRPAKSSAINSAPIVSPKKDTKDASPVSSPVVDVHEAADAPAAQTNATPIAAAPAPAPLEPLKEVPKEVKESKEPVTPKSAPKATKEQLISALTAVNSGKGLVFARNILMKFSVDRLSSLKEEFYDEFLNECNSVLNS